MESGNLLDGTLAGAKRTTWVKGEELPTVKIGLIPPKMEITGERYFMTVFRCVDCGYLESYAVDRA
jgi:hypothetical protein